MAPKRDAAGKPKGPLSAVAAARLARQSAQAPSGQDSSASEPEITAISVGATPYDGHHSDALPSGLDADVVDFVATIPKPPPTNRLSSFRNGAIKQDDQDGLHMVLNSNESAVILGEYDIEIKKGIATIYGAALSSSSGPQRVFAPSTHAIPQIIARKDGTAIQVTSVKSTLSKLEKLSPLFRNIWAKDSKHSRSFVLLNYANDDELKRSLAALDIDGSLNSVLARISKRIESDVPNPRIMAVGPKSSGKSTLNRLLCNTVLNKTSERKCLYLDLDPGQPEFGPPGQLSLVEINAPVLGPPFTHPATSQSGTFRLIKSHTIAGTTFKDDPDHYVACAQDLLRYASESIPMVVNSCGWVTGLGAGVLIELAPELRLTDLVVLEPVEDDLVTSLQSSQPKVAVHRISRRPARSSPRTPAEARSMQTMAYFHEKSGNLANVYKWTGQSIDALRPWTVTYSGEEAGVSAIASYGQCPNPTFLGEILDGCTVALVVVEDGAFETHLETQTDQPSGSGLGTCPEDLQYILPNSEGFCPPLDPKNSECLGLALVRGINKRSKAIHLVTPIHESRMEQLAGRKVVLVRGGFDAPEWSYQESLYAAEKGEGHIPDGEVRPWVSKKEMVGVEGAVWRLRHPPMASQALH